MPKRIVVKLGTSVLTGGTTRLDRARMVEIARQSADLRRQKHEVVIVSSGAVAAGREVLHFPTLPDSITTRQMLAAVGQSRLMQVWGDLFAIYRLTVAQVLLTRADVENRARYLNARDTLRGLLEQGIIPIVNENDVVAYDEIKVGDNDTLSAMVGVLTESDLLLLLTDQKGLFSADPRTDPAARLIHEVTQIDDDVRRMAGGSVGGLGTGGMWTKLQAAEIATRAGMDVIIAAGRQDNVIGRLVAGEGLGTRFVARESVRDHRRRWLLAGSRPEGRITIDAGATAALVQHGRSLLPAGIVAIEGEFERGDTVAILDPAGREVARGITRYTGRDLAVIRGCQSAEIPAKLGYTYGKVAIHRNDLIIR
jgi:glutamate 5-kinase